jgi:DNA/RNA-binding domain of Phe-tRNA-synthetase-like protein
LRYRLISALAWGVQLPVRRLVWRRDGQPDLVDGSRGSYAPPWMADAASTLLAVTEEWKCAFPGAVVGALGIRGVSNPEHSPGLEAAKRRLEEQLRAGEPDPDAEPVLRAYVEYYRARGKTYHVKAQRESVALKRKPIPRRAALVEAMFVAELANLVLTAGHDLDALETPLRVGVTSDGDRYVLLSGADAVLERGDLGARSRARASTWRSRAPSPSPTVAA